jgi:CRISPR-associated protein Csb2
MSLTLEIEYLGGVCYAAPSQESTTPDWPPQPDRVFSALVATWAARGESRGEAAALEWLEQQVTPRILATGYAPRSGGLHYVPPNDPQGGRSGNAAVLPSLRPRKDRRFPAAIPAVAIVRMQWASATPDDVTFGALQSLALDTSYVGHSASLTRCYFGRDVSFDKQYGEALVPERRVYPGRLKELRQSYSEFVQSGGRRGRPQPGALVLSEPELPQEPPHAFSERWLILEHVEGVMPDFRASAVVARTIRAALLAGYERIGLADAIPAEVSGHAVDGSPTREPHLSIIPLAFVGYPYADGSVLGFALVPPRGSDIIQNADFLRALRAIAPMDETRGRRMLSLKPAPGADGIGFSLGLSPTFEPPAGRYSLNPKPYCAAGTLFGTVTPIVLDRHLKSAGAAQDEEISEQIGKACERIGLPVPRSVVPHKHSAVQGVPSARPSSGSPPWMRWRVPPSLRTRTLVHAVIGFAEPVRGPVILGAGRFVGLGLCRPLGGQHA